MLELGFLPATHVLMMARHGRQMTEPGAAQGPGTRDFVQVGPLKGGDCRHAVLWLMRCLIRRHRPLRRLDQMEAALAAAT